MEAIAKRSVFSALQAKKLKCSTVSEGGTLIVLDGGGGEISGVEKIAKAVGARIVPLDATNGTITDQSGEVLGSGIVIGFLEGEGKPLLYLRQGQSSKRVIGMEVPIGKGRLFLSTTVSLFSDSSLGENSAVPSRRQLWILRLMYALYSARGMPAERQRGHASDKLSAWQRDWYTLHSASFAFAADAPAARWRSIAEQSFTGNFLY